MLLESAMLRDETILEMYNEIGGMVRNFAYNHKEDNPSMDFDDYLHHASVAMLEVWPRIPETCTNIKAYLHGTARHALFKLLRHQEPNTLSIDNPIAPESNETFADVLEAPVMAQDEQQEQREDLVAEVVHDALKECRLEEQIYARKAFELNSFYPVPPCWPCRVNYNRRTNNMRESIKLRFKRNPQVLALMS